MLNVNFIEIGTSNFDTLIEKATDSTTGLSIEPLRFYLDDLPNKQNVKKINCAVSFDNCIHKDYIYFIDPETVNNYKLPSYLLGCNKIGDYHALHIKENITHLVSKQEVFLIPLSSILIAYDIGEIDFLKLDTEGMDYLILQNFLEYLNHKDKAFWPKKIEFEANFLTNQKDIEATINMYKNLGYHQIKYLTTSGIKETIQTLDFVKDVISIVMFLS